MHRVCTADKFIIKTEWPLRLLGAAIFIVNLHKDNALLSTKTVTYTHFHQKDEARKVDCGLTIVILELGIVREGITDVNAKIKNNATAGNPLIAQANTSTQTSLAEVVRAIVIVFFLVSTVHKTYETGYVELVSTVIRVEVVLTYCLNWNTGVLEIVGRRANRNIVGTRVVTYVSFYREYVRQHKVCSYVNTAKNQTDGVDGNINLGVCIIARERENGQGQDH